MRAGVFERTWWAVALALTLTIGAMLRFPGGTALEPEGERYSISRNFLSDLGMTVAYNGETNRLGASLFAASLLLLIVGLGGLLVVIVRQYGVDPASRRWARAAVACGFLACAAFTGVALTPEDRVMSLHIAFTMWAFRIAPVGAVLMA